jgi:hypothetical protein
MKFRELFQDVEDWFWKLEFNPESLSYELYLGIPNDWVYSEKNGLIDIELIHQLEENSIVKVSSKDDDVSIDDIIDTAKALISKNQELEKRKQQHKEEMENLAKILVEKEKSFLEYVDTVKENTLKSTDTVNDAVSDAISDAVINAVEKAEGAIEGTIEGVNDGVNDGVSDGVNFLKDIEKLKLT